VLCTVRIADAVGENVFNRNSLLISVVGSVLSHSLLVDFHLSVLA
jgi:hypothetical protein